MSSWADSNATLGSEVDDYLTRERDRFRGWLERLVATDSEAPRERAAQHALVELSRAAGLDADLIEIDPLTLERDPRFIPTGMKFEDRPNCVVSIPDRTGAAIVCNAHIDTVGIGAGWSRNPLGEWDGDRFFGRGACDTKGSTVAALMAMTCLRDLDRASSPIVLHSVIDEEPGGNGTLAMARAEQAVGRPRLVIVMEPTDLDFLSGHRGMLWYRFACHGEAGHGSTGTGINAIERAAEVVLKLRQTASDLVSNHVGPDPAPTINTGLIHGGTEVYTTPGRCDIELSARYSFGQLDELQVAIQGALDACNLPGTVDEVFRRDFDAAATPHSNPTYSSARSVVRRHHPGSDDGHLAGTCDMRHYRAIGEHPTAVFGPGSLAVAHGPDEFVDFVEVEQAARILIDIAVSATDGAGDHA